MVLHDELDRECPSIEEATAYLQPDQLHIYQMQKVLECSEHDLHLSNGRILVSLRNFDFLIA